MLIDGYNLITAKVGVFVGMFVERLFDVYCR